MAAPAPPLLEPALRQGRSVRGLLAIYTAALVLPILVFAAVVLWTYAASERLRLQADAGDTAKAVAVGIDRDLTGLFASLDALSTSAYLQGGDLEGFYGQAAELSRRQDIVPVLSDLSGQQLVNTRLPWGTPLPRTNLPITAAEIAAGRPIVTDLFKGQVSNRLIYAVAVSVMRNGVPAYVLDFSLSTDRLQRLIVEADAPPGTVASVVDRAGTIMARSDRASEFVGRQASADFRGAATGSSGSWSGRTVDGSDVLGSYRRSTLSSFAGAVSVRYSDLNAPLWRSLSLFVALGLVILGLSVVLGLFFGQKITLPIRSLADHAARLGRGGEEVPPLVTGLAEANAVGAELAAAARNRLAHEVALRDANEEIQRFAYIVSHDLRSPLVNIMGFTTELEVLKGDALKRIAELEAEGGRDGEAATAEIRSDIDEAIGFIKASIGKMDRLITAILGLSREGRRDFKPERIDMDELVSTIRASLAHQAETADAAIVTAPLPSLTSDRLAIEQVFSNLIDNALKYLRRGVPGRVEVTGRATPDGLVYEVKDNGRGIDPRDRERIFELFRRSGVQDRPGEGIGLAHVRALVRRLGGSIDLASEFGQGSTFTVAFPRGRGGEAKGEV